jgi:hypothetical protein
MAEAWRWLFKQSTYPLVKPIIAGRGTSLIKRGRLMSAKRNYNDKV